MSVSVCRQRIRKRLCADRKGNTAPPRSSLASKTSKSSTDTNIRCAETQVMSQPSNNATILPCEYMRTLGAHPIYSD